MSSPAPLPLDPADLRESLSRFPSGATIVTTTDAEGTWWGFTASSFCSLSADPPLVVVCLAVSAECHPVFEAADHWAIHFVHTEHESLALRFATRGVDKFGDAGFVAGDTGVPVHPEAPVVLECRAWARYPGGDHTMLVGEVVAARWSEHPPSVYYRRSFRALSE